MTDQNVVRLVADLQRKISQLDMQISLMKPIAQQVADIVGQTRTDSDVNRSVTINTKNRTSVIDRQKTISKDTDLKSPKAEDSKLLNQDDWLKSFAFNYVPQPDGPAKPDEKIVPVTDERDKIFEEAEQKEKGISIWRTKTSFKKDKGLLSESRKLLSAFSDSSKKLDILSPPVPKLRPENGLPKKNPIETLKRQETQRLSVTSQSSDESDSSAAYNPSQTISLDETMLRKEYDSLARTASKNYTSMKGRRGSQRVYKKNDCPSDNSGSKQNSKGILDQMTPEPSEYRGSDALIKKHIDLKISKSDGRGKNETGPKIYEVGIHDIKEMVRSYSRRSSVANSMNVSLGSYSNCEETHTAVHREMNNSHVIQNQYSEDISINIEESGTSTNLRAPKSQERVGDSDLLSTTPSHTIDDKRLKASEWPSLDRQSNKRPSLSAASYKKSVYSEIIKVTTTAKYNEKGSLASSIDQKTSESTNVADVVADNPERVTESFWLKGLNPLSSFNVWRDCLMAIFYISALWLIPLELGFSVGIHEGYSVVLSIVFLFDTLLESITLRAKHPALARFKEPTLKDWQAHYFATNFIADSITIFPFELLPVAGAEYLHLVRLIRVYKLPHIMATSPKFISMRKGLEKALGIGQAFSGIFPLMFCLCAFLHVQASAIFWVGTAAGFSNSAIAQVQFKSVGDQYTWALFTAVGNTFPLSYKPISTIEQLVVLVFIIVGAGLYASIVGTISSFAMGVDASGRLYKQKMDELKEYMRWKELSDTTRRKVLKYYEIKYRGKFFEEGTLLNEMNDSLRMEIAAHNCRQLIQKVGFLRREVGDGRDELFVGRIATALTACYFVPGDVIITQGEIGYEMYFILHGCVDIVVNGKRVVQFKDGAFFGELALIANIPRTASVQAASSCMLYRLTRPDFMSILAEFEDMRKRIDVIYNERMAKVKLEEEERKALSPEVTPAADFHEISNSADG